ncbi:hypothetical protein C8263_04145 [Deinococcus arcticus]|uniref:TubC N-terminal docking domain-containing protein n=1 Tax=Deinococcus arcticus TaxID=2136176 RepID=A0A2T3WAX8_9DEIO|nr:hypothetical protein C8263_04145 [Deinococcus arcticus]
MGGLLARLTACGATVGAGEGGALTLSGKRPPAPLLEELRARKGAVLAFLAAGGEVVTNCDNLPPPAGPVAPSPGEGVALPDNRRAARVLALQA